jgi:hypothetical protein
MLDEVGEGDVMWRPEGGTDLGAKRRTVPDILGPRCERRGFRDGRLAGKPPS